MPKTYKQRPPYEEVAKLLEYNPETGHLLWLENSTRNKKRIGKRAGCLDKTSGYRVIGVKTSLGSQAFLEHHLCWLLYYKKWPEHDIDHKDKVRRNNRKKNLRKATASQNQANHTMHAHNSVGYKGVQFFNKKYQVKIKVEGKQIYLGRFDDLKEAALAYNKAALKYFGEFASLNKVRVKLSPRALKALFS